MKVYLTAYDPENSAEGNIDPLGLYSIADYLALQLIPGIRERQKHPRFLTHIAVGLSIFEEVSRILAEDAFKVDRWQVFEWFVVSGLVKTAKENSSIFGLPGVDKARVALSTDLPLCPDRYLKTPSVFGFHGIYKLLAKTIEIERGDQLGETGYQLLETWTLEQGLKGFVGSSDGPGKRLKQIFAKSFAESLKAGEVNETWKWSHWPFFEQHLHHLKPGKQEAKVILAAILSDSVGFRKSIFEFLKSSEGLKVWDRGEFSERAIHQAIRKSANPKLKSLIDAIGVYEQFARYMTDAFSDAREHMTRSRNVATPNELSNLKGIKLGAERIPEIYGEIRDLLEPWGQAQRFELAFSKFSLKTSATEFCETLFRHHIDIQQKKPPNGKNPWFLFDDSARYRLRPAYYTESRGTYNSDYVHAYRSLSVRGFLADLGEISNG